MHWSLDCNEYDDCCGINVIFGFPQRNENFTEADYDYDDDDGNWHKLSATQRQELKDIIKKGVNDKVKFFYNKGMFQIILNNWQNRRFGSVVKSCGFKMKQSFVNPNTDNKLFFYFLLCRQPTKKSTLKRKFG